MPESRSAAIWPMPDVAPVITTTFPCMARLVYRPEAAHASGKIR
jgi:hypothetical protein